MAHDPLSQSTRLAKRNLLAVAAIAIVVRTFEIGIEKIPIAGASLTFNDGAFTALALAGLIYFGIQFAFYYWIDINNDETTEHQAKSRQKYETKTEWFHSDFVQTDLKKISAKYKKINYSNLKLKEYYQSLQGFHPLTLDEVLPDLDKASFVPTGHAKLTTDEREAIWKDVRRLGMKYRVWFLGYWLIQIARHVGVNAVYVLRNHGLDGIFPVAMGVLAISVLYGVNLKWIVPLLPLKQNAG